MLRLALVLCAALAAGCTTLSGARPLAVGEHEIGLMAGGGLIDFGGPLPLPNAVVGGRSGIARALDRNLDAHYGLNLTALPFGIVQVHGGAGWQLLGDKDDRFGLALVDRIFFATNLVAGGREPGTPRVWAANQVEILGSWRTGHHVHSVGLAQYLDFGDPSPALTPSLNTALDFGEEGGFVIQAEARWYGITQVHQLDAVTWIPGKPGVLGIAIGASVRF